MRTSFICGIYRECDIAHFYGLVNCEEFIYFPMKVVRVGRTNVER